MVPNFIELSKTKLYNKPVPKLGPIFVGWSF